MKLNSEINEILKARFGHDNLIAIATVDGDTPYVRAVNAYYEDGSFYVVTNARSAKMRQLEKNPRIAICGDWFTAHGTGENIGHVLKSELADMMSKLRVLFEAWYNLGHVDENDPDTVLLRIRLTDGVLFNHGTRYEIEFN